MPGTSRTIVDVVMLLPNLSLEQGHSFPQPPGMLTVDHSQSSLEKCPPLKGTTSSKFMSLPQGCLTAYDWLCGDTKTWHPYLDLEQLRRTILVPGLPVGSAEGFATTAWRSTFSLCPTPLCSCPHKRTPQKTSYMSVSAIKSDFWWTWRKTNALSH